MKGAGRVEYTRDTRNTRDCGWGAFGAGGVKRAGGRFGASRWSLVGDAADEAALEQFVLQEAIRTVVCELGM